MQAPSAAAVIGRDGQLELLRAALAGAFAGRGGLVLISGEPGIGKSALAAALAAEAVQQGARVITARAPETRGAPPYWLWTQAVRRELELGGPPEGRPSQIPAVLRPHPIVPGQRRDHQEAVEDEAERFRLADEIATFMIERARAGCRLIVLDDLHAADASSLHALAHLVGRLSSNALLLVATYRDVAQDLTPALKELLACAAHEASTVWIPLVGLDVEGVRTQLGSIIGRPVDSELAMRVHERTAGNPLFTAEIARLLTQPAVAGAAAPAAVPSGIREVLSARLGRLPGQTKDILERAALLGQEMPIDILAAACDADPAVVLDGLQPAVDAALVRDGTAPGHVRFVHGLVAEVIVDALPMSRAAALHQQVAVAIENRRSGDLDDWLAGLARHWSLATPSERASRRTVATARLAALQAEARLAFADAVPLWRTALAAVARSGCPASERAALSLGLARSLFRSGEVAEAVRGVLRAAADAEAAQDSDVLIATALVVEGVSEPEWAPALIALAEKALGQADAGDMGLRARLLAQVGQLLHLTADDGQQRERAEIQRAIELAESSGDAAVLQAALRAHQLVISGPQDVNARLQNSARMIALGSASGDPWPALWGRLWGFDALLQLGDLARAEVELRELEPLVARMRWPVARWHLLRAQAAVHQVRGRFAEARATADEALEQILGAGLKRAEGTHTTFLETQADVVGELPGGDERLQRLLDLVVREPHVTVRAITSLIRVGRVEEARAFYARLPPPSRWSPPRYVLSVALMERMLAAIRLDLRAEAEELLERFTPLARWHVAFGSGAHVSFGSGFTYTGMAAGYLGDSERAIGDLTRAVEENARSGAVARTVIARQELAEALERRGSGTDVQSARRLASTVLNEARRLGMRPAGERADALLTRIPRIRVRAEELTPRELEVAGLVAQGLTNRQLAGRLGISVRTAENHVDHIRSKLGFSSRAQVAAWMAASVRS